MGNLLMACLPEIEAISMPYIYLLFPIAKLPYTVVINAPGIPVCGVLMKNQINGFKLIAFLSSCLKIPQERCSTYG